MLKEERSRSGDCKDTPDTPKVIFMHWVSQKHPCKKDTFRNDIPWAKQFSLDVIVKFHHGGWSLLGSLVRLSLPSLPYQESSCSTGPLSPAYNWLWNTLQKGYELWPTPHNWLPPISSDPSNTLTATYPRPKELPGFCMSEVHSVRLSRRSCMMALEFIVNWEVVGSVVLYPTLDLAWIRTINCVVENGKAIVLWIIYIWLYMHFLRLNDNGHFEVKMGEICNSFLLSFCLPQMATQIWMDILPQISPVAGNEKQNLSPLRHDVPWFLPSNSPLFAVHQSVDSLNLIQQSTTKKTKNNCLFVRFPVCSRARIPSWPHNLIKVTALSL